MLVFVLVLGAEYSRCFGCFVAEWVQDDRGDGMIHTLSRTRMKLSTSMTLFWWLTRFMLAMGRLGAAGGPAGASCFCSSAFLGRAILLLCRWFGADLRYLGYRRGGGGGLGGLCELSDALVMIVMSGTVWCWGGGPWEIACGSGGLEVGRERSGKGQGRLAKCGRERVYWKFGGAQLLADLGEHLGTWNSG